jgi:hypothetical protein
LLIFIIRHDNEGEEVIICKDNDDQLQNGSKELEMRHGQGESVASKFALWWLFACNIL